MGILEIIGIVVGALATIYGVYVLRKQRQQDLYRLMRDSINKNTSTVIQLNDDVINLSMEKQNLEQLLYEAQALCDDYKKQIERFQNTISRLESRSIERTDKINQLDRDLNEIKKEYRQLESQIQEYKRQIAVYEKRIKDLEGNNVDK